MTKEQRSWGLFRRTALLLCVPLVVAAFTCPARAETASAPDSARIARVRLDLLHYHDVQIVTGTAKVLTRDPAVASDGLWLRGDVRHWGITSSSMPPQLRQVPWAEIEAIRARRGASGTGVVFGSTVGLLVGSAIVLGRDFPFGGSTSGKPIVWGFLGGALFGALIDRPGSWKPIYPGSPGDSFRAARRD